MGRMRYDAAASVRSRCHCAIVEDRLNTLCPQCGAENAAHHRFCHFCGYALTSDPGSAPRLTGGGASSEFRGAAVVGTGAAWLAGAMRLSQQRLAGAIPALEAAFPGRAGIADAEAGAGRIRLWEVAAVAALTLVALFIRVQSLETVPAGIANDEAELALEALRIANGESWPGAWTGIVLGTPTGPIYAQALLFRLLEVSIGTARLSAALPGVALIPVAYLLMRELFSARAAALTAAFVTFHVWFLALSRIAFPVTPAVLCFAAGVWLLLAGARSNRRWLAGLGGVLFGLGWYTYKPFLLYGAGVWGVLVLLLLARRDARRPEVYWFLGASVAIGAHMAFLYLTGALASGLEHYERTPLAPLPLLSRTWEVIAYVHTPIPHEGITGTGGIPLLHLSTELFFWIGLGLLLLFIKRRSSQLLLVGWLIALSPAVLTPDGESRRYLLGILFVLAIAAVGVDAIVSLLHDRWRLYARTLPIPILAGWFGSTVAAVVLAGFVLLFAAQQDTDYADWLVQSEWALARDGVAAARFARSLGEEYEVRFYSDRMGVANAPIRWFINGMEARNGSPNFGGSGGIDAESVSGPTVWLLSEDYLTLIPELEKAFPRGSLTIENNEQGWLLYAAYTLADP